MLKYDRECVKVKRTYVGPTYKGMGCYEDWREEQKACFTVRFSFSR